MTRHRVLLVGLFALVAFVQTLLYAAYLRNDPGNYNGAGANGDQVAYIGLAQDILHGQWVGQEHYMPGEPAAIALGQLALGDARWGVAVIQGLIYAALVVGAAALAGAAFGRPSTLWAAALVALNPAIGYYAGQALTELLTGALLFAAVGAVFLWGRRRGPGWLVAGGVALAGAGYVRSEYLALAPLFALVVLVSDRRSGHRPAAALGQAVVLMVTTAGLVLPWAARYAVSTGQPAVYNESPVSDLILKGTWYRVFDESTFARLEAIETSNVSREEAIAQAARVGPRPELAQRYMEQARGPYDRPVSEALALAAGNVRLEPVRILLNHLVVAPVLIWAGRTPLRQADVPLLPSPARYLLWGLQLMLLGVALWQAVRALRPPETNALALAFLASLTFLTLLHSLIAVDERFTAPALPLVMTFAGAGLATIWVRWRVRGVVRQPRPELAKVR
ncbi:MAG: glycosyltransferase family 39 protein [Chloroflexi bacterium]|nr:glycosyltransferase family 39 protein [Chloroflexota bacterium]